MEKKRFMISIDEKILKKIKRLAAMQGTTTTAVISDIICGFVDKNSSAITEFENAAKKFYEKVKW